MKKSTLVCMLIMSILSNTLYGQNFEVPQHYEFKTAADYTKFEKDVIDGAKWLKETPLNEQTDKRKMVAAFLLTWINGSPTVNVEINPTIMDFEKKNEGMLVLYMSASARYVLENNYSKDMRAKHRAALRDMIAVYKTGKGIKRDKKMEKLIKSDEEGKIDEWLAENLKINQ
ncbi:hypothetical protein LK994_06500 [Ferruginibacter lapsinanis]|uniref:hypothetical protein n=1 Tax=Ferruginibacter lapsinanis TaxID=563172 RepID=UPI001E4ACB12|nr:hypothetical protein [Ferruginibacter lapsinanis]UEG51122.1 hypothetical protein LK994_06500 [Ferruginibacter lapsinanis]